MCVLILGKLVILYLALELREVEGQHDWLERIHYPLRPMPPSVVNGTRVPNPDTESPEFRLEEKDWRVHTKKNYREDNRPYRISPFLKQYSRWTKDWYYNGKENPWHLGCYCTTVFKRYTPLAGCAVITSRHILTTASATELILQHYRGHDSIEIILGAWYDHNADTFNSSLYMAPARIHYHPQFSWPHEVNITHPLPFLYDLSVWAGTHKFLGSYLTIHKAIICSRGGPHWHHYRSSTPGWNEMAHVVGFQFVKANRRVPMPWFKYVVRTRRHYQTCPKAEWHWYHCMPGDAWSKYGVESGAAWHRQIEKRHWLFDGLIGMHAFSMKLRTEELTHYFTVVNTHPVLDFLYDSYMGRLPYEFLDHRFYNTQWRAPYPKPWASIWYYYEFGYDHLFWYGAPYY